MVTQVGGVGVGAYLSLIGRRRGCGLGVGGKHFLGKLQHMGIRSRKKKPPLTGLILSQERHGEILQSK